MLRKNITTQPKLGFDIRIVSYEKIHVINPEDFDFLIKKMNVESNFKILDVGCGYGAITREILKKHHNKDIKIFLLDLFIEQLKLAIKKLTELYGDIIVDDKLNFNLGNIIKTDYPNNFFDRIVAKMVLHELPVKKMENKIIDALKEIRRILKKDGELFIWDVALTNENQKLIQNIIREKDKLAGFNYLVDNRYLPTTNEWETFLRDAGFFKIKKLKDINYIFNSRLRLEAEFGNDEEKLEKLHKFIRKEVKKYPDVVLNKIKYKDSGKQISFIIPKNILRISK